MSVIALLWTPQCGVFVSKLQFSGPKLVITTDGEETVYTAEVDLNQLTETSTVVVKSGKWLGKTRDGNVQEVLLNNNSGSSRTDRDYLN